MLKHLTIHHYALIEKLDIDWENGYSVITGETGAGKSIMLGALNLLLGGRADTKVIRDGEKKCMVEATFSIDKDEYATFFEENDIDYDADECILRREVLSSGKSRAFINDTPVSAARLKELGALLIDIHSQHQNLLIHNEHFLLDILDITAGNRSVYNDFLNAYLSYTTEKEKLRALQEKSTSGKEDQEYLVFQCNRIEEAALHADEQAPLEKEQQLLSHTEEIKQSLFNARQLINNEEYSLSQNLRMAIDQMRGVSDNYPDADSLADRLESARIEIDDIDAELDSRIEQTDCDPGRLAQVEERLNLIYELEQKYRVSTIEELLETARRIREQLDEIANIDELILKQEERVSQAKAKLTASSAALSLTRKESAELMQGELIKTLHNLGMHNIGIEIRLTAREEPNRHGADNVAFMFSANKNAKLQDVSQIASGGEIARLMLALKAFIAQRTSLPTIIFDEIDTGVSGDMAEKMALVMKQIAEHCQVICITHLPQIAAMGAHHFKVYKEDTDTLTQSHIVKLDEAGRVEEIAHMLSGSTITDAAIKNAEAMLSLSHATHLSE